jgi:hypothetical protein
VRRLFAIALVVGAAALVPASAGALDECRGLQQCVSVIGPWVVVPPAGASGVARVEWELRCPLRGYVVGGTDARVTSRSIDVRILGRTGSPVSPGVTTRSRLVFVAERATANGGEAFLPAIGCLPSQGGGGRSQTSVGAIRPVVKPGSPFVRNVVEVKLPAGATRRVSATCPKGTRPVGGAVAVGFQSEFAPEPATLSSVATSLARTARGVRVEARRAGVGRGTPSLVQVSAICAKATR